MMSCFGTCPSVPKTSPSVSNTRPGVSNTRLGVSNTSLVLVGHFPRVSGTSPTLSLSLSLSIYIYIYVCIYIYIYNIYIYKTPKVGGKHVGDVGALDDELHLQLFRDLPGRAVPPQLSNLKETTSYTNETTSYTNETTSYTNQ